MWNDFITLNNVGTPGFYNSCQIYKLMGRNTNTGATATAAASAAAAPVAKAAEAVEEVKEKAEDASA